MKRPNAKSVIRMVLAESLPANHKLVMIAMVSYWDVAIDCDETWIAEKSGVPMPTLSLVLEDLVRLTYIKRLIVQKRGKDLTHYSIAANILQKIDS